MDMPTVQLYSELDREHDSFQRKADLGPCELRLKKSAAGSEISKRRWKLCLVHSHGEYGDTHHENIVAALHNYV